ncbi:MAG: hypothetical protein IT530_21030 [Burkholderiales bacterium]|nr:hypothetical protein [Burkholderiales bacterium]
MMELSIGCGTNRDRDAILCGPACIDPEQRVHAAFIDTRSVGAVVAKLGIGAERRKKSPGSTAVEPCVHPAFRMRAVQTRMAYKPWARCRT